MPQKKFYRLLLTSFCGELFIFTAFSVFLQKGTSMHGFEPLSFCTSWTSYSTAPTVKYCIYISCEIKSDSVNVEKQMRSIFVRNAVNFEMSFVRYAVNYFFYRAHRIQRISCIICHKSWCGKFLQEMRRNIFSPHSPHSSHFLQKSTQRPRPGQTHILTH